jgi:hypothetical protein
MEEVWKFIEGFGENYEISSFGRVRNSKTSKYLKPYSNSDGYLVVGLSKNNKIKTISVHRLVAKSFIPNPNNLPEVNHKDYNVTNNCYDNLEWCNRQYNIEYSKNRIAKATKERFSRTIYQYSSEGILIKIWNLVMDIQRELGLNSRQVTDCCNNKVKTCGNYVWSYRPLSLKEIKEKFLRNQKPVLQLSPEGMLIREWDSAKLAGISLTVDTGHIAKCCKGERSSAGGFKWRYKEND